MRYDVVQREPVAALYAAAPGDANTIPAAAARAFATLEAALPPGGRRIYGNWHPPAREYGLRLRGEDVYARIGPSFATLAQTIEPDGERPWLEFYRRHDHVDLLIPIA